MSATQTTQHVTIDPNGLYRGEEDGIPNDWRTLIIESSVTHERHLVDLHDAGNVTVSPAPVYDVLSLDEWTVYLAELNAVRKAADQLAGRVNGEAA